MVSRSVNETLIVRSKGISPRGRVCSVADGCPHGKIAAQQRPAKPLATDFDLLGQRNFFFAREQRDARHLREIHPDRIVAEFGQQVGGQRRFAGRLGLLSGGRHFENGRASS